MTTNNNYEVEVSWKVLTPTEFGGDIYSDRGYEIDGVKSERSYISRKGAENALRRKLEKMLTDQTV